MQRIRTNSLVNERAGILGIVQARLGSSRLPGKALYAFGGSTVLGTLLKSLKDSRSVDKWIVATTRRPEDDAIAFEAKRFGIDFFRGSTNDVLGRFYIAASKFITHRIVRITADCPLVYGSFVDYVLEESFGFPGITSTAKYYPDGFDVETFPASLLIRAATITNRPYDLEHVTPWMYRNYPVKFLSPGRNYRRVKLSLDNPRDYVILKNIFKRNRCWKDYVGISKSLSRSV